MPASLDQVRAKVASQRDLLPAMYGDVDFSLTPERYTDDPDQSFLQRNLRMKVATPRRSQLELVRAYTMLGDLVADAYAALMPRYGFRRLIEMLTTACDRGVEAVEDAPAELVAFLRDMERTPDWLDMDLVREGARLERNPLANATPLVIRGAFIATFLNKYSALPMALTGTLTDKTAARRVNETATFFTLSAMPGALERHGEGFKAAAMVRLMHSMVRFNVLRRLDRWDVKVYGIPIPQVDQMPAGLISVFFLSLEALRQGRERFTPQERAQVELSRYRCFLLGLPEDLLADTPRGILEIMTARNITLRDGFDDATCGALIRATLDAYLPPDRSLRNRLFHEVEHRFARVMFINLFLSGDRASAAAMGVEVDALDLAVATVTGLLMHARVVAFFRAMRVPALRGPIDRHLVRKLRRLLARYGHAEFTTDASHYRPAVPHATPQPA